MTCRTGCWCLLAALTLAMAGCSDDTVTPDSAVTRDAGPDVAQPAEAGQPDGPPAAPKTFVTFNAGLAEGAVPYAVERQPLIIDALKGLTADVVCLQEVWTDADATAVIEGVKAAYPHSFREPTEDTSTAQVRCADAGQVLALKSCVDTNCTPSGIPASTCVTTTCKTQYDVLTVDCRLCLAANTANPTSCAFGGAKDFVYEGRNGLLLLSRTPIQAPTYTAMETLLIKRGVIRATVGDVTVLCTHLPADLGAVPYPTGKTYTSWVEEHAGSVDVLLAAATGSGCQVLLGDLNTGPAIAGLVGELPANFKKLTDSAFSEDWASPKCTFCKDNPLTGATDDRWIDHLFFQGCSGAPTYARILDSPVNFDSGGQNVEARLSDHYGLRATLP